MPSISFQNSQIYYQWLQERTHGNDQPTVVLINSMFSDSRVFGELYKTLIDKKIPIIAIDNSNLGRSTYLGRAIPLARQVEELDQVCQKENISKPIWIANSSAAGIACLAAASLKTHGLILGSPVLSCGIETRLKLLRSIIAKALEDETLSNLCETICFLALGTEFLNKNPRFVFTLTLKVRELYSHKDFLVVWEQTNGEEEDDATKILSITCPTLIIRGREEMMQPLHILQKLFDRQNCQITTLPIGHYLLNEARAETIELIASFVNSLSTQKQLSSIS